MPFVTVQLGQCGNQLGAAWFDTVAKELGSGAYSTHAADSFFQQRRGDRPTTAAPDDRQWAARAVLADMEPKVIYSAKQSALASSNGWCYAPGCSAAGQSGCGNNWALGHNKFGPAMAPAVLDLVRKQVEACDVFEGFLMLQSMAGGTGAGAGTYMAQALVDDYSSAHVLNCCVWPFESGEVTVQPYNTLLSMSSLVELSSGILLLQNEVLAATCSRLLGIKHPTFKDLNAVAARGLASAMLPCHQRQVQAAHSVSSSLNKQPPPSTTAASHLSISSLPLSPIADLTCHLFSHPSYRVASVRTLPQVPAGSMDYTTFSWKPFTARLKGMALSGSYLDEHLSNYLTADGCGRLAPHKYKNKANTAMMVLRGKEAVTAPVSDFADPGMYPPWAVDPLLVAQHPAKFGGCQMSATLLATDQAGVLPLRAMQDKAYGMLSARAYVHQYEAHGMQQADFTQAFACVEDVLAAYDAMQL